MVSVNSPEWLPAGWTMQVKERSGRKKKKCYLDPKGVRKFYSKPEVTRYLETLKNGTSDDKSDGIDRLTGDRALSESVATKENEGSDWLPDGWIIDVKTKKFGTEMREIHKHFIEPESGQIFLSKSEVLSYLANKNTNESGQTKACSDTGNEVPEWLPDGWTVEVKTYSGGARRYKCYSHPSSERKFLSKPQVLKYLATSNSSVPRRIQGERDSSEPLKAQNSEATDVSHNVSKKKSVTHRVNSNKVISRTPAEGLPPGWLKEIRVRKYARYSAKDPYYVDPLSGYMFRSKPDALRYLKTGDIKKCVIKPKKMDIDEEPPSICAVDRLKSVNTETKRQLFEDKGAEKSEERQDSKAIVASITIPDNLEENHTPEKCIEPETPALLIAENTSVSTPPNDVLQGIGTSEEKIAEHSKQMNTSKKKSTPTFPARSSKRLKGLEPEIKCIPLLNEQAIRAAAREIPKQLEEPPEKATNESTTHLGNTEAGQDREAEMANMEEQTNDENVEPQISTLLGDCTWTDPCLEFAVKTLRGEIPVDGPLIPAPCQQGSFSLEASKNEHQTKVN